MIYICEYNGAADKQTMQRKAEQLPISLPEGWADGTKWEKQRVRILAWLLLEKALWRECGYSLSQLEIRWRDHGKPYSSAHPEIHFNLSHCDTACACIVSSEEAGVDIERKFPYRKSLERRICHEEEMQIMEALTAGERSSQLRFLWSMKESFVKLDGRGLAYGMDRINLAPVLPVDPDEEDCLQVSGLRFLIRSTGAYTLAACGRNLNAQICHVQEGELLK